jgi:hypothetical protein
MALQIKDETAGVVVMEISGGAALIGIDGSADAVHILAVAGNVFIKSTGVVYDNRTVSSCPLPTTGSATTDGSGNAVITTGLSQAVIVPASTDLNGYTSTTFTLHGAASTSLPYRYW